MFKITWHIYFDYGLLSDTMRHVYWRILGAFLFSAYNTKDQKCFNGFISFLHKQDSETDFKMLSLLPFLEFSFGTMCSLLDKHYIKRNRQTISRMIYHI